MRAGRVVRALALVAVGEQQHDRATLAPLLLGRGDELVDDRLRAVDEVAELRLPAHQRVRVARPSSRTRSPSRRTRRAASRRPRACAWSVVQVLQRHALAAGGAVDDAPRGAAERAAPRVLAGEPHRRALDEQRAEGEQSRRSPSRCRRRATIAAAARSSGASLGCTVKPSGDVGVRVADALDDLERRSRWRTSRGAGRPLLGSAARAARPVLGSSAPAPRGLGEDPLELLLVVAQRLPRPPRR